MKWTRGLPILLVTLVTYGYAEEADNVMVSQWPDEPDIRSRMEHYAHEKFAHNYHHFANFSDNDTARKAIRTTKKQSTLALKRKKRDGGILSGPIATAVVTGMIGMTARTVSDLTTFHPMNSEGGCKWFGTAPLCNWPCPSEYDYIRPHNGRCSNFWLSSLCSPDPSFGEPCSTVLGSYFHKRFCCKSDPNECTWTGRWMGSNTAHNAYCRYDNSIGRCGEISCSINHFTMKAHDRSAIGGERCDELKMFNATGHATCGYIAWFDEGGEMVNSWYKTS